MGPGHAEAQETLALACYPQDATGLSIKRIVQTLRPLQQITVRIAGHDHVAADPFTPTTQAILDALNNDAQWHTPGGTSQARGPG